MNDGSLRPARLFTAFGTVLFVDAASGELRHGPTESSPANVLLEPYKNSPGHVRWGRLVYTASGSSEPIDCYPDICLSASQSQHENLSSGSTTLELIPLERGLLTLKSGGFFLSAIPDGRMMLRAPVCSSWELFIASENWCTEVSAKGEWRAADHEYDKVRIQNHIVRPDLRAKSNRRPDFPKMLIYGYTKWSHGRIYYDIACQLNERGFVVDIIDWQEDNAVYFDSLRDYYDLYLTALDGVSSLVDSYKIPLDKLIAISHHEFDIRMLVEKKGLGIFDEFAAYGVVSESVYSASIMLGIARAPKVASLGIDYKSFFSALPERLATVGYATSMSVKTFGVEWKRGDLAEAAVNEAGLAFKVAGSTANQISFHDMPNFYRSVDAVVSSSVNESGPLSVMEGAAAGRLVIGTPVGHFPRKAYQGGGILAPIETNKFKAFTAATLRYYRDNPAAFVEKCLSIQEAAREFDWAYTIGEWIDLIEEAGRSIKGDESKTPLAGHRDGDLSPLEKGIICDIGWLSTYLADEHYYLISLLVENYGFKLIDSKSTDFSSESILNYINSFDFIIVAYQGHVYIPLERISSYKILKIDDLVSYDEGYDNILKRHIALSDMIISPYAYELTNFFEHKSVEWVPYSSALESYEGYESIIFNDSPINKVLLSGSIAWDRPLRKFAAELKDDRIHKLDHPGYHRKYNNETDAIVKKRYYEELNKYLCCLCDGHTYRYVHLKNFEIASVGSLLLADRLIEKELNELGFVDFETCIFCDRLDLVERISWILGEENRQAVDRIRRAGMRLARQRHMTKSRAKQIDELVRAIELDASVARRS
ncbi:glycosyltransferase [Mesorhizobium sp. ESP7-2]|uniref:glycosyltransferase n=1 Tax=Mesorhizobium sp. ESP7-2 TaxID=2876622 RepID=UPI001CCF2BA2|nr:glycosyltransferase [Mesorhizobium sp. ESP7-2]MBZ9711269.1 glycosyltransferase [Mesorhizobium sp. ESP7-2]